MGLTNKFPNGTPQQQKKSLKGQHNKKTNNANHMQSKKISV